MSKLLPLSLAALTGASLLGALWYQGNVATYVPREASQPLNSAQGMMEYLTMLRKNVVTGQVDPADYLRAKTAALSFAPAQAKSVGFQWAEMGPNNVGGRTRAICLDPNDPNIVWAGAVSGGLWKSEDGANTWTRMYGLSETLIISSITITLNGHIYVATGHSAEGAGANGSSGFIGQGIFRSVDGGATFTNVVAPSAPWSLGQPWAITNKIVADPNDANKIWVAHNDGPRIYDEAANSFSNVPGIAGSSFCSSLEVVKASQTGVTAILLRTGTQNWRSLDGGNSFQQIPAASGLPSSGIGRVEFAISPQDHNYMFAVIATGGGSMHGGYASTDAGATWQQIWPSGVDAPALDIFGDNNQGNYDIIAAVNPLDKNEVFFGGVSLWKTSLNGQPEQVAVTANFPGCFICVHADVHELTWSPDGSTLYVGCDGGVYKSFGPSGSQAYVASNRNYNVTQFYSAQISPQGKIVGGTQDNGTQYVPLFPNDPQRATEVFGGDGFDCEISQLDPNIMFATVYFGSLGRSSNEGGVFGGFYDDRILALGDPGSLTDGLGDFYTNIRLFEDPNDLNSPDSALYARQWVVPPPTPPQQDPDTFWVADTLGDPFYYNSKKMPSVPVPQTTWQLEGFPVGTTSNSYYLSGDTVRYLIRLPDRVETLFALGLNSAEGIWVTRNACNFSAAPEWWKVAANSGGSVNVLEWSPNGDALFWGTSEGDVFRIMGFDQAYDSASADVTSTANVISDVVQVYNGSTPITGLCVDPNNNNYLLITRGGYGGVDKVLFIDNALQPPPFNVNSNIWNLPADLAGMPVYDGIIHTSSSDLFIIGTEFGVMVSEDGGQNWAFENSGMELVPTFQVRQQTWNWQHPRGSDFVTNPGVVYLGTHGRGFWKSETLLGITGPPSANGNDAGSGGLLVFPNPASDLATVGFELRANAQVQATVFDLNGRVVRTVPAQRLGKGSQRLDMNVSDLATGTYIVDLRVDGVSRTGRFVVSR